MSIFALLNVMLQCLEFNTCHVFFRFSGLQNWVAFSSLHKPLFSEHNSVYFANSQNPPADFNNAFCKVGIYILTFSSYPIAIVILTCAYSRRPNAWSGRSEWWEESVFASYYHLLCVFIHLVLNIRETSLFQDIQFTKVYSNAPSVFVSANHSSSGGNKDPMHNSITAWVEVRQ